MIAAFKEDLYKVCSGGTTRRKQGLQPGTPGRILEISWSPW
jgi:hypothetical protein